MEQTKAFGLIVILLIVWALYKAHRNVDSSINVFDLLMENGRLSKLSCVFMGSWVLTSWMMVELVVQGKLTEGYLSLYGATWVAPIIARLFAPASAQPTTVPLP